MIRIGCLKSLMSAFQFECASDVKQHCHKKFKSKSLQHRKFTMSNSITVRIPLEDSGDEKCFLSIKKTINQIKDEVQKLKKSNLDSEQIRDQYIIHLQQCQEDHAILRQIYKNLKLKIDQESYSMNPQQDDLDLKPQIVQPQRSPTIEIVNVEPKVLCMSENPPVKNLKILRQISTSSNVTTIVYSPNGKKIAFADNDFTYITDANVDADQSTMLDEIPFDPVGPNESSKFGRCLAFSPDSQSLAIGNGRSIKLYDIQKSNNIQFLNSLEGQSGVITALHFRNDSSWIISGSDDGSICVWNPKSKIPEISLEPEKESRFPIVSIVAPSDCNYYMVGYYNGGIVIYNDHFKSSTAFSSNQATMNFLVMHPTNEKLFATISQDKTIKIWKIVAVASQLYNFQSHTDSVTSAAFSSIDNVLFTGSKDSTIRIWNCNNGNELYTIEFNEGTITHIAHHPTLPMFASCSSTGLITVWSYEK